MLASHAPDRGGKVPRAPRGSSERLHVGLHDARNAAYASVLGEFVGSAAALFEAIAESLSSDVDADLVPELETVSHGLGHAVDADGYALDNVCLDAGVARFARDANELSDARRSAVACGPSARWRAIPSNGA